MDNKDLLLEVSDLLTELYPSVESINEKIRILEKLEDISLAVNYRPNLFALEEAQKLLELPDLTYSQRLRLSWLPDVDFDDPDEIASRILPTANNPFDIQTLQTLSNYVSPANRATILSLT